MKKNILLLCVSILTIFSACKKGIHNNSNSIVGAWELRKVTANLSADYPSGSGIILKFSDTTYQSYSNGLFQKSGHYLIIGDTTIGLNSCDSYSASQFSNRIIYDNDTSSNKQFIQISNNVLSIFSAGCPAIDGGALYKYERQ